MTPCCDERIANARRRGRCNAVYVSRRDLADRLSEKPHEAARIDFVLPVTIALDIVTINVTHADVSLFGHPARHSRAEDSCIGPFSVVRPWSWANAQVSPTHRKLSFIAAIASGSKVPSAERIAPRRGEGPIDSDLSVLSKGKRVLHVNPEIAHRVLNLAVTEKDLDGAKVAGRPVDDRRLRSAK